VGLQIDDSKTTIDAGDLVNGLFRHPLAGRMKDDRRSGIIQTFGPDRRLAPAASMSDAHQLVQTTESSNEIGVNVVVSTVLAMFVSRKI
jgi:hypothetical protein